jgi:hypothetical protein
MEKQSFNGTISASNNSVSFTSAYSNEYELPPSLAAVAGIYTGSSGTPVAVEATSITVTADGLVTGSTAGGCNLSGTLTPRARGNAYCVAITLGGASCSAANASLSGIAYYSAASKRLIAAVMAPNRESGILFLGNKP